MRNIINTLKELFWNTKDSNLYTPPTLASLLDHYKVHRDCVRSEDTHLEYCPVFSDARGDTPIYDRLEREWMDHGFDAIAHVW